MTTQLPHRIPEGRPSRSVDGRGPNLGDTTFAITRADKDHPVPVRGAVVAFEVSDLDAEVARLQKLGVRSRREITETPVCRFAIILDPDGSEVILHRRKTSV
jgi:predicted enzyme related to lactoylglutathione lyase